MIKKNSISLLMAAGFMLLLGSCSPKNEMAENEKDQINAYLASHPDEPFTKTSSGLYYLETLEGTGIMPNPDDSAFVKYTGMFLDGQIFDTNTDENTTYDFVVGENIVGFDLGLLMMKEGGSSKLLIPSDLGYGVYGSYPYIAGYTPLLFEISLVKVVPAAAIK